MGRRCRLGTRTDTRTDTVTVPPRRAAPPAPLPQRLPALLRRPPVRPERQREPGPAAHQRLGAGGQRGAAAHAAVRAAPRAPPAAAQRGPPARYGPAIHPPSIRHPPGIPRARDAGLRPPCAAPGASCPPAAVLCSHSRLAHAAGPQEDGDAALPAARAPPAQRAHHDQRQVPGGLLHRLPPAGPGTPWPVLGVWGGSLLGG